MELFTLIIVISILGGLLTIANQFKIAKERTEQFEEMGIDPNKAIHTGQYLYGHPDIDTPINKTFISPKDDKLEIYNSNEPTDNDWYAKKPVKLGEININEIEKITIEDASTIERRVTIPRLVLTGIFAFALKKKTTHVSSYLVITWKKGKFQHEAFFEFEGSAALTLGNQARNQLIKIAS